MLEQLLLKLDPSSIRLTTEEFSSGYEDFLNGTFPQEIGTYTCFLADYLLQEFKLPTRETETLQRAIILTRLTYMREENGVVVDKTRKFSDAYAFTHPLDVASIVSHFTGLNARERREEISLEIICAILHDDVEDFPAVEEKYRELRRKVKQGLPISEEEKQQYLNLVEEQLERLVDYVFPEHKRKDEIKDLLRALTKCPWESPEDYYTRIKLGGYRALMIKLADKLHNISTEFKLEKMPERVLKRLETFREAQILLDMVLTYIRDRVAYYLVGQKKITQEEYNSFVNGLDKQDERNDNFYLVLQKLNQLREDDFSAVPELRGLYGLYKEVLNALHSEYHVLEDFLIRNYIPEHIGISGVELRRIRSEVYDSVIEYYGEGGFNTRTTQGNHELDGFLLKVDTAIMRGNLDSMMDGASSGEEKARLLLLYFSAFGVLIHRYMGLEPNSHNGTLKFKKSEDYSLMWNDVGLLPLTNG